MHRLGVFLNRILVLVAALALLVPLASCGNSGASPTAKSPAIAVTGAASHSMALKQDGTIWAWGSNAYAQLGDGTRTSDVFPGEVVGRVA